MKTGFYTKTQNNLPIHILGDLGMSSETLNAVKSMADIAYYIGNAKEEYKIVAKEIMDTIMYDNGVVNRFEKEKYPKLHFDNITNAVSVFCSQNVGFEFDEEIINELCCGEKSRLEGKAGYLSIKWAIEAYFKDL